MSTTLPTAHNVALNKTVPPSTNLYHHLSLGIVRYTKAPRSKQLSPLEETLAAIEVVDDDSNALSEVIPLEDSNNPKEGDEKDELEE